MNSVHYHIDFFIDFVTVLPSIVLGHSIQVSQGQGTHDVQLEFRLRIMRK